MASITNYSGDKDMGLGSNAGIPTIATESRSNSVIDDTTNKIMERNHANNVAMFKQKVDDRDSLYKALAAGQVTVGDIDPSDRAYYEKSKKAQSAAFDNMSQNGGINNKEAYRKYVESTTDLNQSATHVQARKIGIDQYKAQMAKEPIPAKKQLIEDQLNKQLAKGTDAMIDPYQASSDFDGTAHKVIGDKGSLIGGGGGGSSTSQTTSTKSTPGKPNTTTTTTKTAPVKGKQVQSINTSGGQEHGSNAPQTGGIVYRNGIPMQVSHQYVDFNKIKSNYRDNFMEATGAGADIQNKLYEHLTDPDIISHPEIRDTYDEMIKKSEQYNNERGFKEQEDGKMSPQDLANGAADIQKLRKAIASPIDPKTGKRSINMSIPELSAYYNLASNEGFSSSSETPMKDLFEMGLKSKEFKLKAQDAASKRELRNAQIHKINKAIEGKSEPEQTQEFNKYWAGNAVGILTKTPKNSLAGDKAAIDISGRVQYKDSRPIYTQDVNGNPKLLKPIGAKNIYDVTDGYGKPTNKSRIVGYEGGYYEPQFYSKSGGGVIGLDKIQQAFSKAKSEDGNLTEQQFLVNISNGGINYRMQGENNTSANMDDNSDNLRKLNNKFQKRKDEDAPIADDGDVFTETPVQEKP